MADEKQALAMKTIEPDGLDYPFAAPPAPGELLEVADGIFWFRVPLPFRLDHVNIFLLRDGEGYTAIDTGIADDATITAWERILDGPLAGTRITRLVATHFHPDHIGLAGWLYERFGVPLLTSQTSYMTCLDISLRPGALETDTYRDFYLRHGMAPDAAQRVLTQGHNYLRMVQPLPPTFGRLVAGDRLDIGPRRFEILVGDGHAADQLMMHAAGDGIFLAADQLLARISPNIAVWAVDPHGDPLGLYIRSLRAIAAQVPDGTLVLPGHGLPFRGAARRAEALIAHHHERCERIVEAARVAPRSVADLVPFVFERPLDAHQMSFAFGEVHAHVNYLLRRARLTSHDGPVFTVRAH